MRDIILNRIPSACICYTLIILANTVINLFRFENASSYPVMLFLWIIGCQIIDWVLSFLDFKSWLWYCLTESVILYGSSLAVALLFRWIDVQAADLASFTLIFLAADILVFWYFRRRQQLLAAEINSLISGRNEGDETGPVS